MPGVAVRQSSSGERVIPEVDPSPAIVVATPGAEPVAEGGYAAVLLLDTWLLLGRADLRAAEEAVRRWANAAALVRPASRGRSRPRGRRGGANPRSQALIRWDPGGLARREIDERLSAHLPPASRVATVTGEPDDLEVALTALALPPGAEVLGPVSLDGRGTPATTSRSATWSASLGRRVPRCPAPSATYRRGGRRASCRTCGSRSTRPSWGDPHGVVPTGCGAATHRS